MCEKCSKMCEKCSKMMFNYLFIKLSNSKGYGGPNQGFGGGHNQGGETNSFYYN